MHNGPMPLYRLVQAPADMLTMPNSLIPSLVQLMQHLCLVPNLQPPKVIIALFPILLPHNLAQLMSQEMAAPLHQQRPHLHPHKPHLRFQLLPNIYRLCHGSGQVFSFIFPLSFPLLFPPFFIHSHTSSSHFPSPILQTHKEKIYSLC